MPDALVERGGQVFVVDPDLAVLLTDDLGGDILEEFSRWQGRDGRELCWVPCVSAWARECIAEEIDASEYGMRKQRMNRKELEALRLVRSERGMAQGAAMKRMREKHG